MAWKRYVIFVQNNPISIYVAKVPIFSFRTVCHNLRSALANIEIYWHGIEDIFATVLSFGYPVRLRENNSKSLTLTIQPGFNYANCTWTLTSNSGINEGVFY